MRRWGCQQALHQRIGSLNGSLRLNESVLFASRKRHRHRCFSFVRCTRFQQSTTLNADEQSSKNDVVNHSLHDIKRSSLIDQSVNDRAAEHETHSQQYASTASAQKLDKGSILQSQTPFNIPEGRPYSIPEPELFGQTSRRAMRARIRGKSEAEIPRAKWFANRTGPPLLLTFDAFDTLYTPSEPIATQYAEIAHRFGYSVDENQIQEEFRNAFKAVSAEYPRQGQGNIHYREWWAKVIEKTFEPFKIFRRPWPDHDLSDRLYERFSSKQGYKLFPDVQEFLEFLGTAWQAKDWAPKRTMLGIVSNSDPRVRKILTSFGLEALEAGDPCLYPPRFAPEHRNDKHAYGPALFSFATLSYDCGYEKPDERIFDQAVLDAQSVLAELEPVHRLTRSGLDMLTDVQEEFQFLHVGDNVEKDVLPALRRGWDAILLDRTAQEAMGEREVDVSGSKVTVINSLMSIPQVVTKERLNARLDARLGRKTDENHVKTGSTDPLQDLSAIKRQRREGNVTRGRIHRPLPSLSSRAYEPTTSMVSRKPLHDEIHDSPNPPENEKQDPED